MTEKFLKQISGKMLLCVLALLLLSGTQIAKAQVPKSGNLNQIAILIELQDSKFSNPQSIVDALNGPTTSSLSLDNYIRVASAGKVTIQSHFPKDGSNLFIAKLPYTSADFYQQGSSFILDFNIILKAAVESVKNKFPTGVNFDINNDNLLDIVSVHLALKQPNPDIGLFNFYTQFYPWDGATINGKSIRDVIVNFYENPEGIAKANAGQEMLPVTAHELMHAFGTGEYYYFESAPLWKISLGHWDIMAGSSWTPMILPSAHIRGRLGWIDIPEITTAGRYTLHPATSGRTNGVAYKILTNADPTGKEYTVIEYRRFGGEVAIDGGMYFPNLNNKYASMYGSGLVIYKVNTNFDANNTDFRWDNPRPESEVIRKSELIAYRPDMTPTKFEKDGNYDRAYKNLEQSFFSADAGRTAFTPNTSAYPFLANGTKINDIFITNISSAGETISFDFSRTGVSVNSVTLDKTSIFVKLGDVDQTLTPTILPANAQNGSVTWSTSNDRVATVSAAGVVSFVGVGNCTITVKTNDGNKTATCSVTVGDPPAYPIIAIADEYPIGVTVPLRVIGVGADKLTVFKVNGVEATEFKPAHAFKYEIEASSADGKIKITTYVIVK